MERRNKIRIEMAEIKMFILWPLEYSHAGNIVLNNILQEITTAAGREVRGLIEEGWQKLLQRGIIQG
jgi:hypothetical protein